MRHWKALLLLAVFALGLASRVCLERSYYASQVLTGKARVSSSHSKGEHESVAVQAKLTRGKRRMRHEIQRERALAAVDFQLSSPVLRFLPSAVHELTPVSYSFPPGTPPPTRIAA